MLISPAVLALNGVSLDGLTLLLALAAGFALQVLRHWDIDERQRAPARAGARAPT